MIALMSIYRRGQLLDTFPNEPLSSARFPPPRVLLEGESGPTKQNSRIEKSFGASQPSPQPVELVGLGGSDKSPGGLAQLGERLHGMQKVRGSSPLSSTRKKKEPICESSQVSFFHRYVAIYSDLTESKISVRSDKRSDSGQIMACFGQIRD